jgi:NAD-dependent dihydropyrimidine dehydrogenase PreA subunit
MASKQPSIFDLMNEERTCQVDEEAEKRQRRKELLEPTGVKELFKEGKININKFTCVGGQCRLCIKACPTNALYWGAGSVGVIEDMCVYCGACVLNCMVDDCIKVERKREDGTMEKFSKPNDVIKIAERLNCRKRFERVRTNAATMRHFQEKNDFTEFRNIQQQSIRNENEGLADSLLRKNKDTAKLISKNVNSNSLGRKASRKKRNWFNSLIKRG